MQEMSVRADKAAGEGCPAGPSPQSCSRMAGAAQQHRETECRLLSCCSSSLAPPAKATGRSGRGVADPARPGGWQTLLGWVGRQRQPTQTAARAVRHQPARNFPKPGAPVSPSRPPAGFPPSECRDNSGALQSGEAPITHFPRAIVARSLSEAVAEPSHPAAIPPPRSHRAPFPGNASSPHFPALTSHQQNLP